MHSIHNYIEFPLYYDTSASLHLPPRIRHINRRTINLGYETTRRVGVEEFVVLIIALYWALDIGGSKYRMDVLVREYVKAYKRKISYVKFLKQITIERNHDYWVYNFANLNTEIDEIKIFKRYYSSSPGFALTDYITEIKIAHCKPKLYVENQVRITTHRTFGIYSCFYPFARHEYLDGDICPCKLRLKGCNGCELGTESIDNFAITWPTSDDSTVSDNSDSDSDDDEPRNYKKPKIKHTTITNIYKENLLDPELAALIVTTNGGIKTRHKFHSKP